MSLLEDSEAVAQADFAAVTLSPWWATRLVESTTRWAVLYSSPWWTGQPDCTNTTKGGARVLDTNVAGGSYRALAIQARAAEWSRGRIVLRPLRWAACRGPWILAGGADITLVGMIGLREVRYPKATSHV